MIALVKAIQKWQPYLLGRSLIVYIDHQSLRYLLEQKILTPTQIRRLSKIMGYDLFIKYKKGSENTIAINLSRRVDFEFLALSLPLVEWKS